MLPNLFSIAHFTMLHECYWIMAFRCSYSTRAVNKLNLNNFWGDCAMRIWIWGHNSVVKSVIICYLCIGQLFVCKAKFQSEQLFNHDDHIMKDWFPLITIICRTFNSQGLHFFLKIMHFQHNYANMCVYFKYNYVYKLYFTLYTVWG